MEETISIVGAGRVGRTLGRRLRDLGWTIGAVVTRSESSARRAVRTIGGGKAHTRLTLQVLAADVVLVTTPDDAIARVARALARMGGEEWRGRIVVHTSGALDHRVLDPLARMGAATGSLHPLQTFSGRATPRLESVVFTVEGDRQALRAARRLAIALGGVPVAIRGTDKPAYHAAGALVAGHGLALVEAATRLLMQIGFTRRRAARALLPLMRQMLDNFERYGPHVAWTGPLSRRDYATVAAHDRAMARFPREFRSAYGALTRLAARILAAEPEIALKKLNRLLPGLKGERS